MHQVQPIVGRWYLRPETGRKFEVIDIDDGDGLIEIQDEDGALDQIDSDTWFTDQLEATDQPQNSLGAFDNTSAPDEAAGGDPTMLDADPLRVAQDEMLNDPDEEDDEIADQDESEDR